ncbi:hypothetical protein SS50377_20301 [Spironucleus salmonicida]|uniref:Uncharacterized protein n=1 Tax=Spironucleus salmonicida TaxID=348837 RepID=V6LL49_9EUKA|nr:hypothetical protein SS50377_20301 [Spironucleus salmonicida]|eukprot:EST45355.1 Hypothetical protein SS50377_14935 [Spironucleus salmonicida]
MPPKKATIKSSKPIQQIPQKRPTMIEINSQMSAKSKKLYQSLFTLIDKRDYPQIYKSASELLQAHPDHLDAQSFKAYAIYHMPADQFAIVIDFSPTEQASANKPQQTLQTCGLRLLQAAALHSKTESHLPLQLLANTYKQLQNYSEAASLFGQILAQPHWQTNANFAKERAVCAFLSGEKAANFFEKSLKLSDKSTKTLSLNGLQIAKNELDSTYFDEIRDLIKKEGTISRSGKENWDVEAAGLSQIGFYKNFLQRQNDKSGAIADLESNSELLDIEKRVELLVQLQISSVLNGEWKVELLAESVKLLISRNPDNLLYVKMLITTVIIQHESYEFISENKEKLLIFDVLDIVNQPLKAQVFDIVNSLATSQFQKLQIIVRVNKFVFDENFRFLVAEHLKINNVNSLKILEKFTDITPHLQEINKIVCTFLEKNCKKTIFALSFLLKYTSCEVQNVMGWFKISKFLKGKFDQKLDFKVEKSALKQFQITKNDEFLTYANEKFEEVETQNYFEINNQQIIQEILLLSETLSFESQIEALKLAILLDPRDRFLNVLLSKKQAKYGFQTDSVLTYQRFVARTNALLNLFEIQDQNCLLELAVSPGKQCILEVANAVLDYEDGAKNSEKVTNPRQPLIQHQFSDEENSLIIHNNITNLPLQLKCIVELILVFHEQQQDIRELFLVSLSKYQVDTYMQLLDGYSKDLLKQKNVQLVLSAFQDVLEKIQAIPNDELQKFVDVYEPLFDNLHQKIWAHHTQLDGIEYERLVDYDPFCFDLLKQYLGKGKIRLNKKIGKFIQKAVQAGCQFECGVIQ